MSNFRTMFFVVLPIITNSILAYVSFIFSPQDFADNVPNCWLTITTALMGASATFIFFAIHDLEPEWTLIAVIGHGIALIFVFAGMYRGYGLMESNEYHSMIADWPSSLYFSIVTWTTLGYGDLAPPTKIRLVAAVQALLGYIFLGTSVGLGTYLMCRSKVTSKENKS